MTQGVGARISVVLATCEGMPYLEEQLGSMIGQTRPADEIVVVDDRSDDRTLETVERVLAASGADVRISTNAARLGPAANFGNGILQATGDVIALCDQDDRWRPDRLARLEEVLLRTGAQAAFSDGRLIDGSGSLQAGTLWETAGFTGPLRRRWERGDHLGALLQTNVVTGATLAFRASLRDLVLPIPASAWHDHWIALLAAATGAIVAVPDLLIDYRLHGRNTMGLPDRDLRRRAAARLAAPDPRQTEIPRLKDVRDRLQHCAGTGAAVLRIEEKICHLERRAGLPATRHARIVPVAMEAVSGRYHRLAGGPKSIAVDLIRGPSEPRPPAVAPSPPAPERGTEGGSSPWSEKACGPFMAARSRLAHGWARTTQARAVREIPAVTQWIELAVGPQDLVVSVVMPTRNRAERVGTAISSVLGQRHQRWELVVVDDGSQDETPAVLAALTDERMRVVRSGGGGVSAARNLGLAAATGDVVAYLDDDNVMHPLWLHAVAWAFTTFPEIDSLYGARVVEGEEKVLGLRGGRLPELHFVPFNQRLLGVANFIDTGVFAHRRDLPGARFDESLSHGTEDWDLVGRLAAASPPLALPVIASLYSTRGQQRLSAGAGAAEEGRRVAAMAQGRGGMRMTTSSR